MKPKIIILPKLYIVILDVKYVKSNINAFQNLKDILPYTLGAMVTSQV